MSQIGVDLGGDRLTPDVTWALDALSQGLRLLWLTFGNRKPTEHAAGARVLLSPAVGEELGRLWTQEHCWQQVLASTKSTNTLQGSLSRRCVPSITRVAWALSTFEAALRALYRPRFMQLGVAAPSKLDVTRIPMATGGGDCGFSERGVTLFTECWLAELVFGSGSQVGEVHGVVGAAGSKEAPIGSITHITATTGFERLFHVMQLPSGQVHVRQPASQYVDIAGSSGSGRGTPGQEAGRGAFVPAPSPALGQRGFGGAQGTPLTRSEVRVVSMVPELTLSGVEVAAAIQGLRARDALPPVLSVLPTSL